MRNPGGRFFKLFLTGIVVAVPVMLAVHLVQAVSLPLRMLDTDRTQSAAIKGDSAARDSGFTAGLMKVAADQGSSPKSLVTGVLYTKGKAMIDWNGTRIPLQNGSYAYVGGEIIEMAPDAIGLLKLADGSNVFICPGSKVRLSRNADGEYSLNLISGSSRFSFRADKDFQVTVNDVVMSSALPVQAAGPGDFVTAEVKARQKGGCIICGLKSSLKVTTPTRGGGGKESKAPAGEILDITLDPAASFVNNTIPADIMSGLRTAANGSGQSSAYLCRCQEIQKYAKDLAVASSAIAKAQAQEAAALAEAEAQAAAPAPAETIAEASAPAPEPAPPVAPPDAPPLALAVPGAPDPFDPNVLPPPAAGEPDAPVLVVAPPVIPTTGSGGGLPASPS